MEKCLTVDGSFMWWFLEIDKYFWQPVLQRIWEDGLSVEKSKNSDLNGVASTGSD